MVDLNRLEQTLGQPLHPDWTQLLTEYPPDLLALRRPDGERVSEVDLVRDVDDIVALNAEVRYEPIVDVDGESFDWPENLIIIGENEAGDYYCIDVEHETPPVLMFDHQTLELAEVGEDLSDFVEFLMDLYAGGDE